MRYEHIETAALLAQLRTVVGHAKRANSRRVAEHFATMAAAMHAVLESRSQLRATVAAMFQPVAVPTVDVAALLYGCGYPPETSAPESDSGDGGAKVKRRKPKPQPPTGSGAVPTLAARFAANMQGRI